MYKCTHNIHALMAFNQTIKIYIIKCEINSTERKKIKFCYIYFFSFDSHSFLFAYISGFADCN